MFLGSLKLAVVIILSTATLAAVGTFVEASYNSEVAQKWVYYSIYMKVTLVTLAINLIVSAIHRLPWKKKHTGFVTAHVGILMVLVGSLMTSRMGVDGSMFFEMGATQKKVNISEYELVLYVGEDFQFFPMYSTDVDFIVTSPKKRPIVMKYQGDEFRISDYIPFAIQKTEVVPADTAEAMPALRFQIYNERVNVTEWIQEVGRGRPGILALGPANIILATNDYQPTGGNEIVLKPSSLVSKGNVASGDTVVNYTVFYRDKAKKALKGTLKVGDLVQTGWMGLQFRVLNYYPKAVVKNMFTALERPTPLTTQAIEVDFNGEKRWLGLNSILKFFTKDRNYILKYGNKQIDLGFQMTLRDFEVGRHQGTMRASTYKSTVEVENLGVREISMNEPLKHAGYTFYQASFQEDPQTGAPTASILSVNYDPGRFLKYLGSFLIVLGAFFMFYLGGYFNKKSNA